MKKIINSELQFHKCLKTLIFSIFLILMTYEAIAQVNKTGKVYMGFTPWSYDLTQKAKEKTYSFIRQNSTIISHHLDNGIPWQEALENKPFSNHLMQEWSERTVNSPRTHKRFLSVTPLGFDRISLSPYWNNNGDNQPLPAAWQNLNFNNSKVKLAFLNYTLRAIDFFKPDFLAIGIESNILITEAPHKWPAYIELNAFIYNKIKQRYPKLPVFSTIQYEHLRGIEDDSKPNQHLQVPSVMQLMKHSDFLALSTYRYGFLHPNPPTKDYFNLALSFNKPIAIAETGAMSETTLVMGMPLISNEKSQKEFLRMILQNAKRHRFAFVINWVAIDFNAMLSKLPEEFQQIAKAWVHTGLLDEDFDKKKAYGVWRKYLQIMNRRRGS